jgi:hypothetical protein
MDVSNSAVLLPTTALLNRNSLSIRNLSNTNTLYVGFTSGVTADSVNGTTSGWDVGPQESFNLDITDDIVIYGICETGKPVKIKVMELA